MSDRACPGYLVGALVTQAKASMEAKMKKQHSYGYGYSPYQVLAFTGYYSYSPYQGYSGYSSYQAPSYQAGSYQGGSYQAHGSQAPKYHGSYYEYSRRNGYSLNTEH